MHENEEYVPDDSEHKIAPAIRLRAGLRRVLFLNVFNNNNKMKNCQIIWYTCKNNCLFDNVAILK